MNADWWECTREEYDSDREYVRSTDLKDFHDCPSIYKARHILKPGEHGYMGPKKLGREAVLGTVVHAAALEGKREWRTATNCAAELSSGKNKGKPCGNSTSAAGSPLWDTDNEIFVCRQHCKGRNTVEVENALTPEEERSVLGMIEAIKRSQVAQDLLSERIHERACRSVDADTGVKKKALIDIIKPRPFIIGDLKSTVEFNEDSIWRKIDSNCWGLSFAHYESVVMDIQRENGKPVHYPLWVALIVESAPPYRVTDWPLDDIADQSRAEYRELLAKFAECRETGEYRPRVLNVAVPQWYGYRHGMMNEGSQ